jgi:two-component system, chemotaxis family, chemotaxis protein CheY
VNKPIVLIVDDSPFARSMVRKMVAHHGPYEIHEAADGETAIEMHRELNPELTLLDLNMPGMNGTEVLERIREHSPCAPVVVITADRQQKTIDRVLTLGAYAVVSKPPTRKQIEALLCATCEVFA